MNNSRRPSNIPTVSRSFALSGKSPKVLEGPVTGPSAGPTLAIDVAALDSAVKKSSPNMPRPRASMANVKNQIKKNDKTENITSSEIGRRL